MNKFGIGLIQKSLSIKNLSQLKLTSIDFSYASSKQSKDPKEAQGKKSQNLTNELVRKTKNIQQNLQKNINTKTNQKKSIMTEEQNNSLLFQQKLQATYNQLQSLPSDSYQTVVQNFKRVKANLMDRKVYIPNKPELMAQLDRNMQFVKKHHEVFKVPSTSPQRKLSDSKSQVIEWELEQAKTNYYLSLLQNEKVLIGVATSFIVLFAWLEYYYYIRVEDKRQKLPKMYL